MMEKDCLTCRYFKTDAKAGPCHGCIMKRVYGGKMYENWKPAGFFQKLLEKLGGKR